MPTEIKSKIDVSSQIRININGKWSNVEFINLLTALQNIYELYIISNEIAKYDSIDNFYSGNTDKNSLAITILEKNFMNADVTMIDLKSNKMNIYTDSNSFRLRFTIEDELTILKLKFSSPGFADLGGLGAAIGHIKELIIRLIDLYENRKIKQLEFEKLQIENDLLKIDKAQKVVSLLREIGYPESKIIKILETEDKSIQTLAQFVDNGKIENVE